MAVGVLAVAIVGVIALGGVYLSGSVITTSTVIHGTYEFDEKYVLTNESIISGDEFSKNYPSIYKGNVMWVEYTGWDWRLYSYDISTADRDILITNGSSPISKPYQSDNFFAYILNDVLYYYSYLNDTTTMISSESNITYYLDVQGKYIGWVEYSGNSEMVVIYDTTSATPYVRKVIDNTGTLILKNVVINTNRTTFAYCQQNVTTGEYSAIEMSITGSFSRFLAASTWWLSSFSNEHLFYTTTVTQDATLLDVEANETIYQDDTLRWSYSTTQRSDFAIVIGLTKSPYFFDVVSLVEISTNSSTELQNITSPLASVFGLKLYEYSNGTFGMVYEDSEHVFLRFLVNTDQAEEDGLIESDTDISTRFEESTGVAPETLSWLWLLIIAIVAVASYGYYRWQKNDEYREG